MNELLSSGLLPASLASFDFSAMIRKSITFTIIGFAVWIGIWLLVRQAKLRYWKVDKMMLLLESIDNNIRVIAKNTQKESAKKEKESVVAAEDVNSDSSLI